MASGFGGLKVGLGAGTVARLGGSACRVNAFGKADPLQRKDALTTSGDQILWGAEANQGA